MNQDEAFLLVCEQDMKKRITGGHRFIEFLASPDGDLSHWNNVESLVSSITVFWISSSNFKVVLLGLDILSLLVERLQKKFQVYYSVVENALVDRLGDQRDQVRDATITLLMNIMDVSATPQYLFDRMTSSFSHKAWRVREGVCRLLVATMNRFGARSLVLSKILPHLCKLVADPNEKTRDEAVSAIVAMYRHVGDKVRQDVAKKGLPPSRLQALYDKFDVLLQSGDMAAALGTESLASSPGSFESGYSSSSVGMLPLPASSTTTSRSTSSINDGSSGALASLQPYKSVLPPKSPTSSGTRANAGAVDEESFIRDFNHNLPPVRIHGARDVDEQMTRIQTILSDEKKDWEERMKALKALRAVALSGGIEHDSFHQHLRLMDPGLLLNLKDLRSQVVKETTVTIGFLSSILKNRFDPSASCLMPSLFGLVPNAAKVMSTSGILAIRTLLKHTHSSRLIPIITNYCSSKSTTTRRQSFASLVVIFQHWPTHLLKKHASLLGESVQRGINDADPETREESRKAWRGLHQHFPTEADRVFSCLNASQQKLIKGDFPANPPIDTLPSSAARKKSQPNITTTIGRPRRLVAKAPPSAGLRPLGSSTNSHFLRSRSDIDPASARRSQIKAMASGYIGFGQPRRMIPRSSASSSLATTDRGRHMKRSTTSQPGSRSSSPGSSSRGLLLASGGARTSTSGGPERSSTTDFDPVFTAWENAPRTPHSSPTRKSRIPVSTSRSASRAGSRLGSRAGSQVGSPTGSRSGSPPRYRGRSSSSLQSAPPMRVLPKGREGEMALNDALLRKLNTRDVAASSDDDMSDTSSMCSGMSSNYVTRDGAQRHRGVTDDVAAILQLCQSTSWSERKEGLISLHDLIVERKDFDVPQLKKMLEIFNRMFADPHGKVFSLFIEILPHFIHNYHEQTEEWLYVLLTQLLKKMGSDLLGSVQAKTLKALQIARDTYPTHLQFNVLSRYVIDQTQRPNLKVKVALLHFLLELVSFMEPSEIINSSDTRLALSRIISWTTEPKSHDVRKSAEMVVMAIFERNAPCFTMMLRVLPKTFQDGAMKILQGYRQSHVSTPSSLDPTRRVSAPPTLKTSSEESVGKLTPRGSVNDDSMDRDKIAENFRDITAGIEMLRLDSSNDDVTKEGPSRLEASSDLNVSELSSSHAEQPGVSDGAFIEEQRSEIAAVATAFSDEKDKKRPIDDLTALLRGGDVIDDVGASQQQWNQHFPAILSGVMDAMSTGRDEVRVSAFRAMKSMLRHLPDRLTSHAETVIIHVLQAHADSSEEVAAAAEECADAFCSLLPPVLTIQVLSPLTGGGDSGAVQACLKLLTDAISRSTSEELTNQIISNLVPGLLQCFDHTSSGLRKGAVFCLVALHGMVGDERLRQHLVGLPGGKMKLLQLYIKRSQPTSDPGDA